MTEPEADPGEGGVRQPAESELTPRVRLLRVLPIGATFVVIAVGLALVLTDHWRKGSAAFAVAAALAGFLRLVLPVKIAGVLAVRSRVFDVVFLAVIATGLVLTAWLGVLPK